MYTTSQLRKWVIRPIMDELNENSDHIEAALSAIACLRDELTSGNLGPYHMNHDQHWLLWDTYLVLHPDLASLVRGLASQHRFLQSPDQELQLNIGYATAIFIVWLRSSAQHSLSTLSCNDLIELWISSIQPCSGSDKRQIMITLKEILADQGKSAA